jgi:outer membrane receptor protein involved in Fe transport
MNPLRKTTRIRVAARASLIAILLPVLAVLSGSGLHAQSAPTLPAPPVEPPPVALSPFVIEENTDVGYLATSTLAGSRISTPLKDVAAQISVFTPELMRDLGLTNLEEVYLYSPISRRFTSTPRTSKATSNTRPAATRAPASGRFNCTTTAGPAA